MPARHYRELVAWQLAMDLVGSVYAMTRQFPAIEQFGLTNQLRRAAVSIPSNIAEGQGRGMGREFCHHLRIAIGSLNEVETQVLIAERLGYVKSGVVEKFLDLSAEVGRVTNGLLKSVK